MMDSNGAPIGGGFIMGIWSSFSIWNLFPLSINPQEFVVEFFIKFSSTLLLGVVGGFVGMFGKDLYKKVKDKLYKKSK